MAHLKLYEFAYIPVISQQLKELATLAMEENWNYIQKPSEQPYPILLNYLRYSFDRLIYQNKIEQSGNMACFNTGLVTEYQESIYALFEVNTRPDAQPWFFKKFCKESDLALRDFSKLPEMAHYFDDPAELLFDIRLDLRPNLDHIIDDNPDRFPPPYNDPNQKHALRNLLDGAIKDAKKRTQRNYKTAIPQFYQGSIQLLLPLCLLQRNKADLDQVQNAV